VPSRLDLDRLVEVEPGVRMLVRAADDIERSLYLYSSYEFRSISHFSRLISEGALVIDIGAHVGLYSLIAAHRVGATGMVIAVEPNPGNLARLRRNIEINGLTNVRVIAAALGEVPGRARFHLPSHPAVSGLGSLEERPGTGPTIEVDVRTLDEVLATEAGDRCPGVLKIDVEGEEANVFKGGRRTLGSCRPAVLLEANEPLLTRGRELASPGMQLLREFGYELFGMTGDGITKVRAGEDPTPFREKSLSLNLLALHPAERYHARLSNQILTESAADDRTEVDQTRSSPR
jgi:FkbM family methyltransferase